MRCAPWEKEWLSVGRSHLTQTPRSSTGGRSSSGFDTLLAPLASKASNGACLAVDRLMGIILFLVFGLVIGLIARAVLPGRQSMGFLATTLLGIAGSFVGGFLVSLVTRNRITDLNTAGVVGSILGAILLLVVASRFSGRRALA
jgi:uncharacterized membrane protein YeaQ/YmgE (transglycosylase-associated protein family)